MKTMQYSDLIVNPSDTFFRNTDDLLSYMFVEWSSEEQWH